MKTLCLCVLAAALLPQTARSQAVAQSGSHEAVAIAIDHLRNLEYGQAIQQLQTWVETNPEDLRAQNYLAVSILYQKMFHLGVLESRVYGQGGDIFKASKVDVEPKFQRQLISVLDKAQSIADLRVKSDVKDKEGLYWSGVTHGTRAT